MQIAISFGLASPVVLAGILAIVMACVTWKKHRVPSTLVIASVATYLFYQFVLPILWTYGHPVLYRQLIQYVYLMMWVAILYASIGRRNESGNGSPKFRFQLKHLVLLTLYAAIAIGYAVTLFDKRSALEYFRELRDLPLILVWGLTACIAAVRFRRHPVTSVLVLCGSLTLIGIAAMDPLIREWQSATAGSWVGAARQLRTIRWFAAAVLSPATFFMIVAAVFTDRPSTAVGRRVTNAPQPQAMQTCH